MIKKHMKHIFAVLLSAGLFCMFPFSLSQAAAAEEKSITLICRQDETILCGMQWKLYKIGAREETKINFVPELANYSMDLGDLSAQVVDTAAKTLESYVIASGLPMLSQGRTDENGELKFENLDNGLYLAVGNYMQVDQIVYFPSTLLLEINDNDASFSYDAFPKFYAENLSSSSVAYMVKKVWLDDDDANQKRPVNVTIDLYEDGVLRDTVTLSEENEWKYRWEALRNESKWVAVEREIPVNYKVMIDYNSRQYLIRNSYQETTEVTTTATTVSIQTTTVTTVPTAPVTTTTTDKLIQTGQLWWPVLPLSLGGMVLIGAGISMKNGKKKDEESYR